MSFLQKYDKFLNSKPWIAFVIIAGIVAIATNDPQTEPLYFILGIGLLFWGFYKIYKRTKMPKNNKNVPQIILMKDMQKEKSRKKNMIKLKMTLKNPENS